MLAENALTTLDRMKLMLGLTNKDAALEKLKLMLGLPPDAGATGPTAYPGRS